MKSEYTAKEIIEIIEKCKETREDYLNTYDYIRSLKLKEGEKDVLFNNADYNLFIAVCDEVR